MFCLTEPLLSAELAYRRQRIAAGLARPTGARPRRPFWTARARGTPRADHRLAVGH